MSQTTPDMIGPRAGSTPAAFRRAGGGPHGRLRTLPPDLLRDASRRLGIMALLGATLWVIATGLDHVVSWVMSGGNPVHLRPQPVDAFAAVSVLASLALFRYTRKPDRDPQRSLDLGLVYLVLTALALGMTIHWAPVPHDFPVFPMITWTGAVVLMFAAIVPNAPAKTLVAGLIAASMNPLSMLVARERGTWEFGPAANALVMHYPDYLLVGVAVVISYVVLRLGQQVAQAREMGSYRLGELLGRGGMGEVYRATHRMLARPAAIKLIRPETIGAEQGEHGKLAVRRFRREAEAAASLRSPHTVELYDFGVAEDRTLYFVMELLEGIDLESLVQQYGVVSPGRTIFILRQVCESLEEAHAQGLVHRDIKPANIHLGRVGLRYDFVKVLDFGLVKSMADDADSLATAAGLLPGTPAYMAPEMALNQPVDGRADIYAVGCVAYYLLTGRRVFETESWMQMIAKHLHEEPVPPSRRAGLPLPEALDRLVLACLAKEPGDRPQSAAALARSLAGVDADAWSDDEAMRWWEANRPESLSRAPRRAAASA